MHLHFRRAYDLVILEYYLLEHHAGICAVWLLLGWDVACGILPGP